MILIPIILSSIIVPVLSQQICSQKRVSLKGIAEKFQQISHKLASPLNILNGLLIDSLEIRSNGQIIFRNNKDELAVDDTSTCDFDNKNSTEFEQNHKITFTGVTGIITNEMYICIDEFEKISENNDIISSIENNLKVHLAPEHEDMQSEEFLTTTQCSILQYFYLDANSDEYHNNKVKWSIERTVIITFGYVSDKIENRSFGDTRVSVIFIEGSGLRKITSDRYKSVIDPPDVLFAINYKNMDQLDFDLSQETNAVLPPSITIESTPLLCTKKFVDFDEDDIKKSVRDLEFQVFPLGSRIPGIFVTDISTNLICNNQVFDSDEVSLSNLSEKKKRSSVDYFYQNSFNRIIDNQMAKYRNNFDRDRIIDPMDFHILSSCQGEFSLNPDGLSSEIISYRENLGQDLNSQLNMCYDFSSTVSISINFEFTKKQSWTSTNNSESTWCDSSSNIVHNLINFLSNLGKTFILTFDLFNQQQNSKNPGACECDNENLNCEASLTVSETVNITEIETYISNLKLLILAAQKSTIDDIKIIPFKLNSYNDLAEQSQFLSTCLDWIPPADYQPNNLNPDWIKPNACCGSKKFHTSLYKCCSGREKYFELYDEKTHVCCEGLIYPGSRCPVYTC